MNKKHFKLLIINIFFLNSSILNGYQEFFNKNHIDSKIEKLWSPAKHSIETSISMLKESPIELYFIGSETYNVLYYAFNKKKTPLIDELLQLYLKTLPYIKKEKNYHIFHLSEDREKSEISLEKPIYIWSNKDGDEELISSAQFLFVVSFAINKIVSIPLLKRTKTMNLFLKSFQPILSSHYKRWITGVKEKGGEKVLGSFSRRGWGCKDNQENYIYARTLNQMIGELGEESYHGATYCNVIADPSLLIISGVGYYLAGLDNLQNTYTIPQKKALTTFFIKSINILKQRFKENTLQDSKNKTISILSFQEGYWFGHPDYYYSDYNNLNFPTEKEKKSNLSIGIDVNHASRVIYLLEMLEENKNKFHLKFPSQNEMEMFTNSFFYNVFNQNYEKPLFKNFMNGSNGWFRVNYSSEKGYGYPPYKVGSEGALLGGYPRLAKYNKELEDVFIQLFKKLNSNKKEDRAFIHQFYEKSLWTEGKEREVYQFYEKNINPKSAIFLISFYSSMI